MTRIHIARDRQPLGNFSPDEVADGLKSGRFLPTDLAWQEPMEAWKPLGEFTNLPEPDTEDDDLLVPPPVPTAEAPTGEKVTELAWERRQELGIFAALRETIKQILSEPTLTFRTMKKDGKLGSPLLYYVVLATLGTWMALLCEIIAKKVAPEAMSGFAAKMSSTNSLGAQIAAMVMAPFMIALMAFIASGIIHVVVMGLGGDDKKFVATFRAYCYAVGTAYVFMLIPACGAWIFLVTAPVLLVFSLREVHGISTGRAVVAMVLPGLLYLLILGSACLFLYAMAGSLK